MMGPLLDLIAILHPLLSAVEARFTEIISRYNWGNHGFTPQLITISLYINSKSLIGLEQGSFKKPIVKDQYCTRITRYHKISVICNP